MLAHLDWGKPNSVLLLALLADRLYCSNLNAGLPQKTLCWTNVDLMLAQHYGRWTNIEPTLVQRLGSCWGVLIWTPVPFRAFKGVVNCQNTRDNVVPRMQQWPLDIPQWHITPHPQLSAKIIILYVFHTHRRIKSKFPNHINSIYLSDIYEQIIHHFSYVCFVLWHKRLCYHGGLETVHL